VLHIKPCTHVQVLLTCPCTRNYGTAQNKINELNRNELFICTSAVTCQGKHMEQNAVQNNYEVKKNISYVTITNVGSVPSAVIFTLNYCVFIITYKSGLWTPVIHFPSFCKKAVAATTCVWKHDHDKEFRNYMNIYLLFLICCVRLNLWLQQ
jgi:hypothetical protein